MEETKWRERERARGESNSGKLYTRSLSHRKNARTTPHRHTPAAIRETVTTLLS